MIIVYNYWTEEDHIVNQMSNLYSSDFKIKLFQISFSVDIDEVESCLQMKFI